MKTGLLRGLVSAFAAALIVAAPAQARVTGTIPSTSTAPDTVCWGRSGAEVCVDYNGNLLPTTDNDTTLGTSSLRWATAYILDITVGDDLTVTDDATITGDLSVSGLTVYPATTYTIGASTTITPMSEFGLLTSTGAAITTGFTNGTQFTLMSSTASDITIDDGGSTLFSLSTTTASTDRVFANIGDTLVLRYYNGLWYEVGFSTKNN